MFMLGRAGTTGSFFKMCIESKLFILFILTGGHLPILSKKETLDLYFIGKRESMLSLQSKVCTAGMENDV